MKTEEKINIPDSITSVFEVSKIINIDELCKENDLKREDIKDYYVKWGSIYFMMKNSDEDIDIETLVNEEKHYLIKTIEKFNDYEIIFVYEKYNFNPIKKYNHKPFNELETIELRYHIYSTCEINDDFLKNNKIKKENIENYEILEDCFKFELKNSKRIISHPHNLDLFDYKWYEDIYENGDLIGETNIRRDVCFVR